ncbi:MAG: hypothetical protein WKG01_11170 [Kofleriaceae bacterium]
MTNTASKIELQHPPLARDPFGNLLAIPEGTSAWRICRETTGRPREIRGPDKQPARFPLDITTEELVELCGAGIYRVYALDAVGAQVADEQVAKWDLMPGARELRNVAALDTSSLMSLRPNTHAGSPSDLRFALEAMTQMMRTNSDALRIVAESQVDLAKTLATAKGLPRNAAFITPAITNAAQTEDDNDDDDGRDGDGRPRHIIELLMPLAEKFAEIIPGLVVGRAMQTNPGQGGSKALAPAPDSQHVDDDLATRPGFELRDMVDLGYAKRKGDAKRAAKQQQVVRADAAASIQARIMADPAVMIQLLAIKQQLAAGEIDALMAAVARTSEAEQLKFIDAVQDLPLEAAVEFCRDVVKSIHEQSAPRDIPNPESP